MNLLFLEEASPRALFGMAGEGLGGLLPGVELNVVHAPPQPIAQMRASDPLFAQPWDFVLLTLSAELLLEGPPHPERAQLLGELIESLQERGAAVALATIFRHVPADHPRKTGLHRQLLQLNLMVRKLSHQHACFVLDLDRELAHEGAIKLDADCFGGGEPAAEVAMSELMVLAMEMLGDRLSETGP